MKYDLLFILKYWKAHKKQAVSVLLSFVLLISYIFVSLCMVRTELRRTYFDSQRTSTASQYPTRECGAYNDLFFNISKETADEMAEEEIVEKSAYFYTMGYMGNADYRYTAGCYPDSNAFDMSGARLIEGELPSVSGEVVVSEMVLEVLGISAEVGETIVLTSYEDLQVESGSEKEWKLVGILEDDGGRGTRETCSHTTIRRCFEPVILVSSADIVIQDSNISMMVCVTDGTRISAKEQEEMKNASEDYISPYAEFIIKYLSECEDYVSGGYDSSYFTTVVNLNENYDGYLKSAKSNFYSYTAIAAGLLMAITLSCSLFVILKEKIKSMRLLRRIGYSTARLRRMLIAEGILLTFFGILLGFAVAAGLYEALLQVQYHIFGLEIYRAYGTEWGIKQITYSPIISSVLSGCAVSFVSYVIPVIRMKTMLRNTDKKINRSSVPAHSMGGSIRKIFHQPLIHILQIVSLTLVITISCTALMFFSTNGKSSWQNPQILTQGKYFETNISLDRRTYDIDCAIENQKNSLTMGLMATEVDSGFSVEQADSLENSGLFSACYGWTYLDNIVLAYPKNTDVASDLTYYDDSQFAPGEKEYYGLSDYDVYGVSCALSVNDFMLNEIISAYSENLNSVSDVGKDEVVILSLNGSVPFQIGESLPLFTAYGTADAEASFGCDLKYAETFNAMVADTISIEESDSLLYGILEHYSSDYIILFPTATTQNFTLPYQNFDNIYLKYKDNTSDKDVKSLIYSVNTSLSYMNAKTITDCINDYNRSMLKEYIIAFTVFGLMFVLSLIGYFQTLRLQVYHKSANIRNLRALGMSKKTLCTFMYRQFIKIPILSGLLSIASVYGVRWFLKWRYDECTNLYNMAFEYTDQSSKEFIELYTRFVEQQERFLTSYEMYKVPILGFLIALFIVLFICISAYILILSKNAASMRIIEKMEGEK